MNGWDGSYNPYSHERERYERERHELERMQAMSIMNYNNQLGINQLAAIQSSQSTQKQQQNKLLLLLGQ